MTITAQSADGQLHEFPDGTPQDVIDNAMRQYASEQGQPPDESSTLSEKAFSGLKSVGRNVLETPERIIGMADAVGSTIGNLVTMVVAGGAGLGHTGYELVTSRTPDEFRNAPGPAQTVEKIQAAGQEFFKPRTQFGPDAQATLGKGIEKVGEGIKYPLSAIPFIIGGSEERQEFMEVPIGDYLGELAQDSGASPLWATMAHISPEALLVATGGAASKMKGTPKTAKPSTKEPPKVPSIDDLKTEANGLYNLLDDSGIVIADEVVVAKVGEIIEAVRKQGARKELTPNVINALEVLQKDAAVGRVSLSQAEELRKVLKSGYGSSTADNARITQAIDMWDKFITTIPDKHLVSTTGAVIPAEATQWAKSARSLWSRKRKTEVIEEIIRKAEIDMESGTMTSGFSHSLRVQFRSLAKNDKKMKMFTANEQAAIRLAATGVPFERVMRILGKLAPTNQISIMGDVAAGLGVGAMAGGPAGGAVGLSLPLIGGIARRISNKKMEGYARQASETMRRGD